MSTPMSRIKTSVNYHSSKRKSSDLNFNYSLDVKGYMKAYTKNNLNMPITSISKNTNLLKRTNNSKEKDNIHFNTMSGCTK